MRCPVSPSKTKQRVVHMLAVVAVVRHSLLLAVGRVGGPVQIQEDVGRAHQPGHARGCTGPPAPRRAVRRHDDRPRSRGGTASVGSPDPARWPGSRPQASLNSGSVRRGIGIVLVLVATRDLEHPLPHQRLQAVPHPAPTPLRHTRRQRRAHPERRLRLYDPGQPAITADLSAVELHPEIDVVLPEPEADACPHRCGTLTHRSTVPMWVPSTPTPLAAAGP